LWSALGVAGIVVAWAVGHAVYGPFVLPAPAAAAAELVRLLGAGTAERALVTTVGQALLGFAVGGLAGFLLGAAAASIEPLALALAPVAAMAIAVPPVAWLVLALLWFGPEGAAPAFTVSLTVAPLLFGATLQGLISRDPALDEMAHAFRASTLLRARDVVAPQLAAHLAPALAAALGFAWKVCVMAEVMASGSGIGGELALARAHLDLDRAMAWILLILLMALVGDGALIGPLRRWARRVAADAYVAPAG
jgi:NitT/TauT family transport system permease protein